MKTKLVQFIAVLTVFGAVLTVAPAWAADVTWTGTTGDWGTAGNWDTGEPVAADYAFVENGGTVVLTASGELCSRLNVGYAAGASGNVRIDSGTLDVSSLVWFGKEGAGDGVQNGGNVNMGRLIVGEKSTSVGTYQLDDGTLTVPGLHGYYSGLIGSSGTGTFVQNGGTATFGILGGTGVADMIIGYYIGGNGEYRLEDGTATFYDGLVVGGEGATGTYRQNGGNMVCSAHASLGRNVGGHGTFQLDDGSVDFVMNLAVGREGLGEYIQNGGTSVIHGDIWSGYAGSSITLNGGDLSANIIRLNGISPSGLTCAIHGGTLDANEIRIAVTNDGGAITPGGADTVGTTTFVSSGYGYTQSSTGTLLLELESTSSNDLLDVTATGMTAGGTLKVELIDGFVPTLGDSFDIIDGTITGTFDTLDLPFNAAAWDVSNLYSNGTISFAFSGLAGDINFDNAVDDIDATIFAVNWGRVGATWADGDFNDDNMVNAADAALMAENWLQTASSATAVPEPNVLFLLLVGGLTVIGLHRRTGR